MDILLRKKDFDDYVCCDGICTIDKNKCDSFAKDDSIKKIQECVLYDALLYEKESIVSEHIDYLCESLKEYVKGDSADIKKYLIDCYNKGANLESLHLCCLVPFTKSKNIDNYYIYLIHTNHGTKIGKSKIPIKRIAQIQTEMPFKAKEIRTFKIEDYSVHENNLHNKFKNKRLNGEWFDLTDEDIISIENYMEENGGQEVCKDK